MEKNLIWHDKYTVRTYEVDSFNKLKLESFCNYIQESASRHASFRKAGYHELFSEKCVWMLSRMAVHIYDYPKVTDVVKIETWVDGRDRLFSHRDFHFFNTRGEMIASARTDWLILDLVKKRLRATDDFIPDFPGLPGKCVITEPLGKIEHVDGFDFSSGYTIQLSDLDILQHTNNVNYIKLIYNTLGPRLENQGITKLSINFISESKLNDELQITIKQFGEDANKYFAKIFNSKEIARAVIETK